MSSSNSSQIVSDRTRVKQVSTRHKHGKTTLHIIAPFYPVEWYDGSVSHDPPRTIKPTPN
jgi:hypothetical protein